MSLPSSRHPIRIFAAGSLRRALPAVLGVLHPASDSTPAFDFRFGPAGLLRREIEVLSAAERPDLFVSADIRHAQALKRMGIGLEVRPLAENRLMIVMPARGPASRRLDAISRSFSSQSLPPWLELQLSPGLRVGTSTPGADPGGDYAEALFEGARRYGRLLPEILRAKALRLVGGSIASNAAGRSPSVIERLERRDADLFFSYRTNAVNYEAAGGMRMLEIPDADNVRAVFGMLELTDRGAAVARMLLSRKASAQLESFGFRPLGR